MVCQHTHNPRRKGEKEKIRRSIRKKEGQIFPNLKNNLHIREAQQTPNRIKTKRLTPKHIIATLPKVKNEKKLLKAAKEQ